jgi:glycosyltransferase involved in cell wall biosynthesis
MKIVLFTFYYPPDLCAGSFRAVALANALSLKMKKDADELHVLTTHPNRYPNHHVEADDLEVEGKTTVHRIAVPIHKSGMLSHVRSFVVYAVIAYRLCRKINPDFLIGTTSRLMTGILTGFSANRLRKRYFIDLRDIFSETISDLFSLKSKVLGSITKLILLRLEKNLFRGSVGVNLVSKGFTDYFIENNFDISGWSFFPNGVDQEFLGFSDENKTKRSAAQGKTILYAGNIGNGQGLEKVIPQLSKQLGKDYKFLVVGGGGTELLLKEAVASEVGNNIEMVGPVSRKLLMEYYRKADILFLHLNNVPALKRVLPSKIFEYAALGKPIVAGLSGYSAKFLQDEVPYASLFEPCDFKGGHKAILQVSETIIPSEVIDQFVEKYARESIMERMAEHVFGLVR